MQNIKFYTEEYVHQEIKNLCIKNANCTNGTIFYTFELGKSQIYAVDSSEKNFSYSEILEIYKSYLKRAKIVDTIVKNIKEIEINFDDWDYLDNGSITGSYENENFEVEVKNHLITFYIKVDENGTSSGGYNSPNEYDKKGSTVTVEDIKIEDEEGDNMYLTEQDYKKVLKELIKNIIF